jgi:5-hydroxyisourate hydrolase
VLDTARGVPAAGVPVRLERVSEAGPEEIGRASTDSGGRVQAIGPPRLPPGTYRLIFGTGEYFEGLHATPRGAPEPRPAPGPAFFPEVTVTFTVDGVSPHYHVPLLLSPFGYATYRGS